MKIGRSISSIGKVLGYKIGEQNVKSVPMSTSHRFCYSDLNKILTYKDKYSQLNEYIGYSDNPEVLNKYLKSIGLSKEEIEKSKKHYIISDYAFSGASLAGTKRLFESDFVLGKHPNVHYINVSDLIPKDNKAYPKLYLQLYESMFKKFSFVNQSHYLNETARSIRDTQKAPLLTRLFWFKLLDNEMIK